MSIFNLFLSDYKNIVGNLYQYLPLCLSQQKTHIKLVLLYDFHKSLNVSTVTKSILSIYKDDAYDKRSCRFSRFEQELSVKSP